MLLLIWFWFSVGDFRQIPNSNDWRSSQPSAKELHKFLKSHKIQYVIRMNSSKESPSISTKLEESICKKYGVKFIYINAHKGYVKGKGYLESAKEIEGYLKKYSCLIHCRHGYDRTGAMVGYYLKRKKFPRNKIIKHNLWQNYLKKKSIAYKPYYETALNN